MAIAQGDLGAVGVAFDRHAQELYAYCQSQLGDEADAAEVVEATFVIAAAKASLLHNTARLRAWLFAIARCGCQQRLRAGAKPAYFDEISDWDWDRLGGTAWRSDLLETAWAALAEMNPRDREVAELSIRHGLDPAELTDVLGVPRDQARTLAQSSTDRFEASWDLLLAGCRERSWYCQTAARYLSDLNGDLTLVVPGWMREHTPRCAVCTKRERLNPGSAVVLGFLPAARLAADERERLLWLLSERSAEVEAYCAEVIERLGPFGPEGYPDRAGQPASPRAVRRRGTNVAAAGAAALAVAVLGAGAVFAHKHFGAQSGLQPTAGTHDASPTSAQPGKTDASADTPSPGKHSSSTRSTSGSPSPEQGNPSGSSPWSQPSSPRPARSHSRSSPPSASPSPEPTTPSPTPTPTPSPTPSPTPTPTPTPSPTSSPTSTPSPTSDPTPSSSSTSNPTPTS